MKDEIDTSHSCLYRGAISHAGFDECMEKSIEVVAILGSNCGTVLIASLGVGGDPMRRD